MNNASWRKPPRADITANTDEVCMPLRGDKAHTVVNEYGASPEAMRRTYYFTNHSAVIS